MKTKNVSVAVVSTAALLVLAASGRSQNWPQFLGSNRDARGTFTAPKTWPKQLAEKWKVTVGDGVATPSLVGDKLYVFSRQEGGEIIRCLNAADGKELWRDKYDVLPAQRPAQDFSGPRCSPTVADGKVVTLGLRGLLSCYDAEKGTLLWRKEDFKGQLPRFFTSASPLVTDGFCIAELGGGEGGGGVIAYDLSSGEEKWRWSGDGASYASPQLLTAEGVKMVIAETDRKIVGIAVKGGKQLWEIPFAVQGRGYNASTPVVDGNTLIFGGSGRGFTAVKIVKEGDAFSTKELWKNMDNSVVFNTPVLKAGNLFGLTANNQFFCIDKDGKTAWTAPLSPQKTVATNAATTNPGTTDGASAVQASVPASAGTNSQPAGREGRGGRGGGGGREGYGQIVDAGSVMLALTPASELVVFEPSTKAYSEVARIKVASSPTYAYPIVSGKRIFVKDQDALTLFTVD